MSPEYNGAHQRLSGEESENATAFYTPVGVWLYMPTAAND